MKQQKKKNVIPSLEEMFTEYAPLIFRIVSEHLKNPEDCRECVNDTFLEFYKHPERYDPKNGSLASYLAAIAEKRAISKWRKNRRKNAMEEALLEETSVTGNGGLKEDPAEQIISRMELETALSSLDEEELRLIRLKYYEGMNIREIASDMQLPYETVKKRHQRTLKKLRFLLLVLVLLAALAGCAYYLARKVGIIPGYGVVSEDTETIWCLEEPVSVPVSGTKWQVRITTAVYNGNTLSLQYYLTDSEGRRLLDSELGHFHEGREDAMGSWEHSVTVSAESFLYIGPGHYTDFDPLEGVYIGNSGPEYYDMWLEATLNDLSMDYTEDEDCYTVFEPVWEHESLPAILDKEEGKLTFPLAGDIIMEESEYGIIWKEDKMSDYWSKQIVETRYRFETSLTLHAVISENIDDYDAFYDEEQGGVLAIPRLQDGHLIVALYPLEGRQGKVLSDMVTDARYCGTAEDPQIGTVKAVAEDGTVLEGTLLGNASSNARLYSEWDFGPAEPGTYRLQLPYLLKTYDGGEEGQKAYIPFSLKKGTISGRTVELDGIEITASNLQPLPWEDLLLSSIPSTVNYYGIRETPYYNDTDRLWSFELTAKAANPEETVIALPMATLHKNAGIFAINGECTGEFLYDLPRSGSLKYFLYWEDADNRLYANPLDTWTLEIYTVPEKWIRHGAGILTRWNHPVELILTVEEP